MAPAVVDDLEVVDVQEEHGQAGAAAGGPGQGLVEAVLQQQAVGQAGEGIVHGLVGESLLRLLALGHVADEGHGQVAVGRLDGAEGDVDGELGAVPPAAGQLEAGAHGAGPGVGQVAVPVSHVGGPEAVGKQDLDGLADQLLPVVAEEALGLAVDQHQAPGGIGDHRRVGRRVQHDPEALIGRRQRQLDQVGGLGRLGQLGRLRRLGRLRQRQGRRRQGERGGAVPRGARSHRGFIGGVVRSCHGPTGWFPPTRRASQGAAGWTGVSGWLAGAGVTAGARA